MRIKKYLYIFGYLLLLYSICIGDIYETLGTTSGNFLKLGSGVRPTSLGNTYTSIGDDINSIFYYPAGLCNINDISFTSMYNKYFMNVQGGLLAAGKKIDSRQTLGIGTVFI